MYLELQKWRYISKELFMFTLLQLVLQRPCDRIDDFTRQGWRHCQLFVDVVGVAQDSIKNLVLDGLVPSLDVELSVYLGIVEGRKQENECHHSDLQH